MPCRNLCRKLFRNISQTVKNIGKKFEIQNGKFETLDSKNLVFSMDCWRGIEKVSIFDDNKNAHFLVLQRGFEERRKASVFNGFRACVSETCRNLNPLKKIFVQNNKRSFQFSIHQVAQFYFQMRKDGTARFAIPKISNSLTE